MSKLMEPFQVVLDLENGGFSPSDNIIQRRLSDMRTMYSNRDALEAMLADGNDHLIYEVDATTLPEEEGQVLYCTTTIYPGTVGDEYYMTKGHFHSKRDRAEIYLGLAGEGYLLLQTEDGEVRSEPMKKGTMAYVPPYWAHRTINTGDEPFIFFATWPGDAGHDYGTIEERGFAQLLVFQDGKPTFIENPNYKK